MIRGLGPRVLVLLLFLVIANTGFAAGRVHPHGLAICSVIILEMSEGKVSPQKAAEISHAIALAANRHFGRVTCGEMWLYMAIAYVESGFRSVTNYQNCRGMFQVHAPSWARKFGVSYKDLLYTSINADAGIRVYKYYLERYGQILPALSAYNSDHPHAATGYARAVLGARKRIQKRYTELYRAFHSNDPVARLPVM